jgi:hypothetical protein
MDETEDSPAPPQRARERWRDVWQLHVPLVVVLTLCAVITVIEARRASEGVWRAWAYMFEWPMIGLFTIWIWWRYRKEGRQSRTVRGVSRSLTDGWRSRVAAITAAADVADPPPAVADRQLDDWRNYVDDLHRREPPGQPPAGGSQGCG